MKMDNPEQVSREIYDLIILGAGPAGLTASIYASRYGIKHLVVGSVLGGLASEAHKICNFPTEPEITGMELSRKIQKTAEHLGAVIKLEQVDRVSRQSKLFLVHTSFNNSYLAKNILIATGTQRRKLGLPKEDYYLGKGLSYCATCDGAFFKGKTVGVVGGSDAAVTAALYLSELAQKVFLIYRRGKLRAEKMWLDDLSRQENVDLVLENNVSELRGKGKLESILLEKEFRGSKALKIDGLFIEIGGVPTKEMAEELGVSADKDGYIKINSDGSTNVIGVWAAGDITTGSNRFQQIITACAEGAVAAESIYFHLKETNLN